MLNTTHLGEQYVFNFILFIFIINRILPLLREPTKWPIYKSKLPSMYGNNEHCTLLILAARGYHVHLKFGSFDLEDDFTCMYDYVEIFDGSSGGSAKITKACGRRIPSDIRSSGRFLFVHFRSDGSVQRHGFSASYYSKKILLLLLFFGHKIHILVGVGS